MYSTTHPQELDSRLGGPTSTAPVLVARGVTKTFTGPANSSPVHVLRDISLSVPAGGFVSLVGPSGSGKSTLLHCAAGLDLPTSGSVQLLGQDITRLRPSTRAAHRSKNVGFIFQDYNLVSSLCVRDNIALPARLAGRPLSKTQLHGALERVRLTHRARQRPAALSGGERQRAALARVLANNPVLVFADEPTGALDVESGARVLDWLAELPRSGAAVIMVTHDPKAAARADTTVVLTNGRIHSVLTAADEHLIAQAVLDAQAGVPCTR